MNQFSQRLPLYNYYLSSWFQYHLVQQYPDIITKGSSEAIYKYNNVVLIGILRYRYLLKNTNLHAISEEIKIVPFYANSWNLYFVLIWFCIYGITCYLLSCILFIIQMIEKQFQKPKKQKIIGNYSIGKTIGIGTFANVRQAIHIRTGEKVSIKILNKNLIEEPRDKINLTREMRILKKIRHPNIAQLLQVMETNSRIYFVMEFVEGGELFTRITSNQKGRLAESESSIIFQQLINAVQYLHSIGVAHRDLKPENILLDHNKNVKLIDFGLSSFYQKHQKLTTSCGSPCYAAPEMLVQQAYDPSKSDIWSSGIVLFAMLCGFLPFEDKSTKILYQKIKLGEYEEPNHLSNSAKDLVSQILKFNPSDRLSIPAIRKHSFCQPQQTVIRGLFPCQSFKLEEDIMLQMNKLGYYGFRTDVETHKNTESTAAYYLILYKYLRNKSESLSEYFAKQVSDSHIQSLYRSRSMILKRGENQTSGTLRKLDPLKLVSNRYQNNEEQGDFLDNLVQKNLQKMRQRSLSIRIRKITS